MIKFGCQDFFVFAKVFTATENFYRFLQKFSLLLKTFVRRGGAYPKILFPY